MVIYKDYEGGTYRLGQDEVKTAQQQAEGFLYQSSKRNRYGPVAVGFGKKAR